MSKSPQLPAWTIPRCEEILTASSLSDSERAFGLAVIGYSLPAPTQPDIAKAYDRYVADHDLEPDTDARNKLVMTPNWHLSPCTTVGSQYPLSYAMEQPHLLNRAGEEAKCARTLLSRMFGCVIPHAQPSIYTAQTRHVRDVLVSVLENKDLHGISLHDWDSACRALGSPSMAAERQRLGRQYQTFYALLEKTRRPGQAERDTSSVRRGPREGATPSPALTHHQRHRRDQIADALPSPTTRQQVPTNSDTDWQPMANAMPSELAAQGYRLTRPSNAHRASPDDEAPVLMLERARPSLLTPSDDRRAARRVASMAATDALVTQEDVQRLTPWQVHQVLALTLPPLAHALVRLLLVTGMRVKRLITLTRHPYAPSDSDELDADTPRWDPERGLLYYRLLDGPSQHPDGSQDNCWVILTLPPSLQQALLSADQERPLNGSVTVLNRHLRKHFHALPGISPTANRLRATAWLHMRSLSQNNHLVLTLQGQYGALDAAPAAYRAVPRQRLQALFDAGMQRCGVPVSPSEDQQPLSTQGWVGSGRGLSESTAQQWFTALRDALQASATPIQQWLRVDPLPVEALVTYLQVSAAHTYLGWMVSTGARPVSANTQTHITGTTGWLRDKASSRGLESRVTPLLPAIVEQLSAHQQLLKTAMTLLTDQGYRVEDQRQVDQHWPAWLIPTSKRRTGFRVRALHHGDFRALLCDVLGVDELTVSDNATRHSFTTALHEHLDEALLDALVGHARIGRDRCHPRSLAPITGWQQGTMAMEQRLSAVNFRPLKMEVLRWL
ncbi:hypothetical protein [Halomonas sp. I5-271120]|uniref:hypothetical protein n=1 Tax=Halomonas sp. I5-271120 TaxID=3061632 RepID=UPI0027154DA5|nr:hypothetical protein [Halomonas sp. I5-271120]